MVSRYLVFYISILLICFEVHSTGFEGEEINSHPADAAEWQSPDGWEEDSSEEASDEKTEFGSVRFFYFGKHRAIVTVTPIGHEKLTEKKIFDPKGKTRELKPFVYETLPLGTRLKILVETSAADLENKGYKFEKIGQTSFYQTEIEVVADTKIKIYPLDYPSHLGRVRFFYFGKRRAIVNVTPVGNEKLSENIIFDPKGETRRLKPINYHRLAPGTKLEVLVETYADGLEDEEYEWGKIAHTHFYKAEIIVSKDTKIDINPVNHLKLEISNIGQKSGRVAVMGKYGNEKKFQLIGTSYYFSPGFDKSEFLVPKKKSIQATEDGKEQPTRRLETLSKLKLIALTAGITGVEDAKGQRRGWKKVKEHQFEYEVPVNNEKGKVSLGKNRVEVDFTANSLVMVELNSKKGGLPGALALDFRELGGNLTTKLCQKIKCQYELPIGVEVTVYPFFFNNSYSHRWFYNGVPIKSRSWKFKTEDVHKIKVNFEPNPKLTIIYQTPNGHKLWIHDGLLVREILPNTTKTFDWIRRGKYVSLELITRPSSNYFNLWFVNGRYIDTFRKYGLHLEEDTVIFVISIELVKKMEMADD